MIKISRMCISLSVLTLLSCGASAINVNETNQQALQAMSDAGDAHDEGDFGGAKASFSRASDLFLRLAAYMKQLEIGTLYAIYRKPGAHDYDAIGKLYQQKEEILGLISDPEREDIWEIQKAKLHSGIGAQTRQKVSQTPQSDLQRRPPRDSEPALVINTEGQSPQQRSTSFSRFSGNLKKIFSRRSLNVESESRRKPLKELPVHAGSQFQGGIKKMSESLHEDDE